LVLIVLGKPFFHTNSNDSCQVSELYLEIQAHEEDPEKAEPPFKEMLL